jgi:ABC-2 type transport system ATP-binding protein
MPCIQFQNLTKRFARQSVLQGIDLIMEEGEFLGLVGVNGAGKTTMIKCLLDLVAVTSGSISIFGRTHNEVSSREVLAFLPEKFTPPYYLSGHDFLEYMQRLYGIEPDLDSLQSILRSLDFNEAFLGKPVRQLSKGMSQKLGLAACFLSNKPLYILDEPMTGLDPKARAYLKKFLLDMKQAGKSMFVSTHLLNDVEVLCDRVAILHEGRIQFLGTPAQCCEQFNTSDFESAYLACVSK